MKKADFESIKDMEFFRDMVGKATKQSPVIAAALKDPAKSGIDLNGKIYMTTDLDKNDPEQMTTHILVPLSNSDDFEKLVEAANMNFENKNGLNVFSPDSQGDAVMVWDDNLMTLSFSNASDKDVEAKARMLFELDEEQSIVNNKSFATMKQTFSTPSRSTHQRPTTVLHNS